MLGKSSVEFVAANDTVSLKLKPASNGTENTSNYISLLELAKSAIPPCHLNPFLINGHLHTAWIGLGIFEDVQIHYKRHIFQSDIAAYPGQFAVDFVIDPPDTPPARDKTLPPRTHNFSEKEFKEYITHDDSSPMLLVMHGLSGGSQEQYIRHMLRPLVGKGGWSACVVNARGCGWSKITSPYLFNARATWDLRQVVKWMKETWPKRKLYAIGFSLGANILTNYLGEEGEKCELEAAILVCNPWNLDVCNAMLMSTYIGLNAYMAAMGASLRRLSQRFVCTNWGDYRFGD